MKFISTILTIALLSVATWTADAQSNITLSLDNVSIEQAIDQIEQESSYSFLVADKTVDLGKRVSINVRNTEIDAVLDIILKDSGIRYKIIDRQIILSPQSADTYTLTGTVTDSHGEPVIGAYIVDKDSGEGVISDNNGAYSITVGPDALLEISYLGFATQQIQLTGQRKLNVTMREDRETLDEVVVVGYGTQKRRDLTGSISSVSMDDEPVNSINSVGHMLAGKAAGLYVTQSSAQPGAGVKIRIRGEASTGAGNDALIIVDGMPISDSGNLGNGTAYVNGSTDNMLSFINPNDIESIEVLKDASATAIYGARAGHGVIIITTKRGQEGKARVQYSGNVSVQTMAQAYEMLDGADYMKAANAYAYENYLKTNGLGIYSQYLGKPGTTPGQVFVYPYSASDIANAGEGTDWIDEISRTGIMQNHNVSVSGGTGKTQYLASLSYMNQKGVIRNNDAERFTARINLDQQIGKYVKAGVTMNLARNTFDNVPLGNETDQDKGIIGLAVTWSPLVPVYDSDGNYAENPGQTTNPNPVSLLEITDKTIKDRALLLGYVQVEPVKGLILKANLGVDRQFQKRKFYLPTTTKFGADVSGKAQIAQSDRNDYLMDLTANYNGDFGHHNLNVLAGYSYQQFNYEEFFAGNQDFFTDSFLYNNLGAGEYATPSVGSSASKSALASYFARVNYSFKGRYLLTATVRADGASNFNPDYRWGFFPSVSAGWRFSDEPFMDKVSWISDGKLRASWGQTGNSNIGNRVQNLYTVPGGFIDAIGGVGNKGAYPSQLGNPQITWETTTEVNVGLDMGFLRNRITFSAEYFYREISDLLGSRTLPYYSYISSIAANIGRTQSQGFELTLNTVNITNRNFEWTTNLTLSLYRDRWLERDPNWDPRVYEGATDPIRSIYTYVNDGLLQVGEPAPAHQPDLLPGQIKFVDQNNDGKLNDEDVVFHGSSDPDMMIGFNNTIRFKNFDFNIYFYGQIGATSWGSYYDIWAYNGGNLMVYRAVPVSFWDTWRHDNQDSTYPSPWGHSTYWDGDFFLKKMTWIRCRNITLGYTIPISKKIFDRFRIYAEVNNPFYIATNGWTGLDPETGGGGNFDYPNVRSFNFGIDITF
ncbi:MAG: TonB-dependent receptor [Bacteroidetes bacterium]|uniref:TonB-dependent receptor n=1 Tax=Candidatus Cryptobacteroides intestinavium TaxID=2840766 RepID=A0A9D9EYB8_9BACT|nr:TonB-dependent receptor [Candidatus Cryptobacteroides intestinavium]